MNWYRHLLNNALSDTRTGNPSAAILLEQLHAEQRDIDKAIQHLQQVQRLRSRRRNRFGTLDLSWTVRTVKTETKPKAPPNPTSQRPAP